MSTNKTNKRIIFLCTDKKFNCLECCLEKGCNNICEKMAKIMEVPFTYAKLLKEPDIEYQGC